jgi:hypothetical protein
MAITATPGEVAEESSNAQTDGYGLIGILAHRSIGSFDTFGGPFLNPTADFLAVFQRSGKTFASFGDFLSGYSGCGGE